MMKRLEMRKYISGMLCLMMLGISACGNRAQNTDAATAPIDTGEVIENPVDEQAASDELKETDLTDNEAEPAVAEETEISYDEEKVKKATEILGDTGKQIVELYKAGDYFDLCNVLTSEEYLAAYEEISTLKGDGFSGYWMMAAVDSCYIHMVDKNIEDAKITNDHVLDISNFNRVIIDDDLRLNEEKSGGEFRGWLAEYSVSDDMVYQHNYGQYYYGGILYDADNELIDYSGQGESGKRHITNDADSDSTMVLLCNATYTDGAQTGTAKYTYESYHQSSITDDAHQEANFEYNIKNGLPEALEVKKSNRIIAYDKGAKVKYTWDESEHTENCALICDNDIASSISDKKVGPYTPFAYFNVDVTGE